MAELENLAKSIKKATESKSATITTPGIDSKTENKKLPGYFITIPGSEKISDKKEPKLDSLRTCFNPINAKTDRKRKTAERETKKPRCLFTK